MNLKKSLLAVHPNLIFWFGAIIICIPIFSMDYAFSLDGPTHFHNANIFNHLLFEEDAFVQAHFEFNSEFTPNYLGLVWSAILLKLFSPSVALKLFYLSYILGLLSAMKYFVKSFIELNTIKWTFTILFLFVLSYFVITGFINFYLAFIPLLFTSGYYVRQKQLNIRSFAIVSLGILITYFSHSIVFAFLIILLGSYEFTQTMLIQRNLKKLSYKALWITLFSITPIILTLLFLGQRNNEIGYLELYDLISNLLSMKSLRMFNSQGISLGSFVSAILLVLVTIQIIISYRQKNSFQPKDSLLVAASLFLTCYFILPDSVGYASVFSVRIEFMFWLSIALWLVLSLKNAYLMFFVGFSSAFLLFWNVTVIKSELTQLNSYGKKVISASEYIEPHSVVYPIFASNEWNHFHFGNILGWEKPVLILDNSAARQDYFPIRYTQPFEESLKANPARLFKSGSIEIKIDYLIIIGNEWVAVDQDQALINSLTKKDSLVYENPFIKLYKLD